MPVLWQRDGHDISTLRCTPSQHASLYPLFRLSVLPALNCVCVGAASPHTPDAATGRRFVARRGAAEAFPARVTCTNGGGRGARAARVTAADAASRRPPPRGADDSSSGG